MCWHVHTVPIPSDAYVHGPLEHRAHPVPGSSYTGYELTIFTTDKKNSGTTNDLHVQLVGSKATSKLFTIRNSLGKGTRTAGMLQQGRVDVLHVATQSLGTISSVRVAHVPPKRNQGVCGCGCGCGCLKLCGFVAWVWFQVDNTG